MRIPDPEKTNAQAGGLGRSGNLNTLSADYRTPLRIFQSALEAFNGGRPSKRSGTWFRNNCPTGHRSRDSLSFGEYEDGWLGIRCYSGCDYHDVLSRLGLEPSDLYPQRLRNSTPEGRRAAREAARQADTLATMSVVRTEGLIAMICCGDASRGDLSVGDAARCTQAYRRIEHALGMLNARYR